MIQYTCTGSLQPMKRDKTLHYKLSHKANIVSFLKFIEGDDFEYLFKLNLFLKAGLI